MMRVLESRRNGARIIGIARTRGGGAKAPSRGRLSFPGFGVRQRAVGRKVDGDEGRSWAAWARTGSGKLHAVLALALALAGCFGETFQRGYVLPDGALEQIPLGASQEQVLIVLGTPSTVATVCGEAFYYISQRAERADLLHADRRSPTSA